MRTKIGIRLLCVLVASALVLATGLALAAPAKPAGNVPSLRDWFGWELGPESCSKIAPWRQIEGYFEQLDKKSPLIKVEEIGVSSLGNKVIVAFISSPSNLARLEHYRQINAQLNDPRGLTEDQITQLVKDGKVIIAQSYGLHSSEVGGAQSAPRLAHFLLTDKSADTKRILDNIIFVMLPNINPDGTDMISDWYHEWVGTEYDGCGLPYLYESYSGHDNNRDAYAHNLLQSQAVVKTIFQDWLPQLYIDHHQMGNAGARQFNAPYANPIIPYADPLQWRESAWYGAHMVYKMEEAGLTGVITAAAYPAMANTSAFYRLSVLQNTVGMHTEVANANLASPIYQPLESLRGTNAHNFPEYIPMPNFPSPWPGGWWTLPTMMEHFFYSGYGALDIAARHPETLLKNTARKALNQTERGRQGEICGYVISDEQHDPLTARKLIEKLLFLGIEVKVATEPFTAGGSSYPSGTYVVSLAQPKMGMAKTLLEQFEYPDNYWTRFPNGTPYVSDMQNNVYAEFMGVTVIPVGDDFSEEQYAVAAGAPVIPGTVGSSEDGYVFDPRLNESFKVLNRLLADDVEVWRVDSEIEVGGQVLPPGAFYVDADNAALADLSSLASELGVSFYGLSTAPAVDMTQARALRVGLFQRYEGGNADEGWTRMVLEQFEFEYSTIMDADLADLVDDIDVLIIPDDTWRTLYGPGSTSRPLQWRSGFGNAGVEAIHDFVMAGGRLVTFGRAWDFAARVFEIDVVDRVAGLPTDVHRSTGNTLWARVDVSSPMGYGMPVDALILNYNSPVLEVLSGDYEEIVTYADANVLQSGRLIGEEYLAGQAAMIAFAVGDDGGQVVMISFRPQNRAQTDGTYKLVFNCLR